MIVFDLRCTQEHGFEAWFASSMAYDAQRAAGQIACPYCGSSEVNKAAMAARLGAKSNGRAVKAEAHPLEKLARLQRKMLDGSRWVGGGFANQARAMSEGQTEPATIHGTATVEETRALQEDGVGVMPLLFPVVPPEKRN